jgi:epoxyqueuosine reductase QueG
MTPNELKKYILDLGANLVGFCDVRDLLPVEWQDTPYAISIASALKKEIISGIVKGPTLEYYAEYRRVNTALNDLGSRIAEHLRQFGHVARNFAATDVGIDDNLSTKLPHKTPATCAGLGWIGKSALLVTEKFGPAIRLTTVLTDMELPIGTPILESKCGSCVKCVQYCPGEAMTGRNWDVNCTREDIFDAHACRRAARAKAAEAGISETICGICIAVCPFMAKTKP